MRRTDPGAEGYHAAFEETDPGAPFENGLALPTGGAPPPNDEAWNFLQRHYLASHAQEEVRLPFEEGLLRQKVDPQLLAENFEKFKFDASQGDAMKGPQSVVGVVTSW